MSHVLPVTDATLEAEVLQSEIPVLVDFFADWCGPCKALAPLIEEIATTYRGRLKVVKIDVDQNPGAAQAFRIQSMPTLMLIHEQRLLERIVGLVDRKTLLEKLAPHVGSGSSVERWDIQRAKLAIESGLAVPVDLREAVDYQRARLPGAISAPPVDDGDRLAPLEDKGRRYLFYARTDEGVDEVAETAAQAGYRAAVLAEGLIGWELASAPVEKG
ncbi:MAG: thioredoxin [Deltaproteobacteria bacterium]|nr:MAG: thioredoxin [Deltaproteobacteria bacterium]